MSPAGSCRAPRACWLRSAPAGRGSSKTLASRTAAPGLPAARSRPARRRARAPRPPANGLRCARSFFGLRPFCVEIDHDTAREPDHVAGILDFEAVGSDESARHVNLDRLLGDDIAFFHV